MSHSRSIYFFFSHSSTWELCRFQTNCKRVRASFLNWFRHRQCLSVFVNQKLRLLDAMPFILSFLKKKIIIYPWIHISLIIKKIETISNNRKQTQAGIISGHQTGIYISIDLDFQLHPFCASIFNAQKCWSLERFRRRASKPKNFEFAKILDRRGETRFWPEASLVEINIIATIRWISNLIAKWLHSIISKHFQ